MAKIKMTWKVWFLVVCLVASLFAINPLGYFQHGVLVKSVSDPSTAKDAGLSAGLIIQSINDVPTLSIENYSSTISSIFMGVSQQNITLTTDRGTYRYSAYDLGISVDNNLTITSISSDLSNLNLSTNETVKSIDSQEITNKSVFDSVSSSLNEQIKLKIATNKGTVVFFATHPEFTVSAIPKTRLKAGLDLAGGAKALVQPEGKLTQAQMTDLITVSKERLNVYGIADINIRPATDLSGNNYMIVEIAGASPAELQDLIGKQGKFEAKIGSESVFIGGKDDIKSVCRNDASCSGISRPYLTG